MQLIEIHPEKCDDCRQCIISCPVQAIRMNVENRYPEVDHDRCIGCGSCYRACDKGAVNYLDSRVKVREILKSGRRTAALVDPAISGEFPDITDYRKFVGMIRALGFRLVNDVSFGVDLVAKAYRELFEKHKGKYYITANCPAMVAYIEKFHPELTDNLAPLVSPMIAMTRVVRQIHGNDTEAVYIGPCLATKSEGASYTGDSKIGAVLTFTELRSLFDESGIQESKLEYSDFDPPTGQKGSMYPISRGILEAAEIDQHLVTGEVITADGKNDALKAVKTFGEKIDSIQKHFNLFYNEGCVMGPGTSPNGNKFLRGHLVEQYTRKRIKNTNRAAWEKEIRKFSTLDLSRSFKKDDQRRPEPGEDKIREILRLLGKPENEASSCASCGFDSCRSFARAVAQGLVRTDLCQDFVIRNKENYIDKLRQGNKNLKTEMDSLKANLRTLKQDFDLTSEKLETSRTIMNQIPSGVVIVDNKLKVLSSNNSFIELLGPEAREIDEIIPGLRGADLKTLVPVQFYKTFQNVLNTGEDNLSRDVSIGEAMLNLSVFSIKKNRVAGGIVRDMYSPEVRNEQIIRRVTEVIDQNLEMVQQIGFLLGEGASKTEAMLNTIIELHKGKDGKKRDSRG